MAANWTNAWDLHNLNKDGSMYHCFTTGTALGAIAAAMVGSIFSSDAWNSVTFVAGEMKNPKRDVALSMMLGYHHRNHYLCMANVVYTGVLSCMKLPVADKDRVAVAASHVIFGNMGTYVIAVMIMISTFGCNNGLILSEQGFIIPWLKMACFLKNRHFK
jgi:APA family basic amino acid/polyamine antiporter